MELKKVFEKADREMNELDAKVEKIESYAKLLRSCKIRIASLSGYVNDRNRIDTLRRAELRIEARISKLGQEL